MPPIGDPESGQAKVPEAPLLRRPSAARTAVPTATANTGTGIAAQIRGREVFAGQAMPAAERRPARSAITVQTLVSDMSTG